ncbi:KRAB-A domain-containing protein 2-like isoform X1 [Temnothorax americanus]|uniref:KRAB-A domain-containing protein 2-like isoform X1 n=1 Tax=Temnothorax americanus TaxID=1964332 RepID=UPI0040696BEE
MKKLFNEKLKEIVDNSNDRSDYFTSEQYNQIIFEVREAKLLKDTKNPLSSKQYRRLKRFDIITVGENDKLIEKTGKTPTETFRYYCKTEDLFDILETAHIATGHKRIRVMEAEINKKYCNVTRTAIQIYLSLCEQCQGKKKIKTKGLVVAPILSNHMNSRCQVDLIDMQSEPDRDYRFIFNYQDHLTKFTILRPLKTKTANEVAYNLMDIFCIFGAPFILQSDNGREFVNHVIQNLVDMWPGLKLVHGKPRHSQSQGSVERSNQDVRDMLVAWMLDNNTKQWSEGLRFIQSKKNRSLHEGIKKSPYEAMFGMKQRIGLADSSLERKHMNYWKQKKIWKEYWMG